MMRTLKNQKIIYHEKSFNSYLFNICRKCTFAQTNITTVSQEGANQEALTEQKGTSNDISIRQISNKTQSAWVFQSGEMEDETTGEIVPGGEENQATVDQTYSGNGNCSFLYQFGSFNESYQKQNGNGNAFNIAGNFPENFSSLSEMPDDAVPTQDGDLHWISQIAIGNNNQAWMYQAGRDHDASQLITGDDNQVWTSQSGYTQSSEMIIVGNGNGSHYLEHEEGKFPHTDDEEGDEGHGGNPGGKGKGNCEDSGGQSYEGGMPGEIPPPHDEDHVFVHTVGVAIKQMGSNSRAEMYIDGDDNKAVIIQRGGAGSPGKESKSGKGSGSCEGSHFVNQDIYGNWNRIFADQRGTSHTFIQYVNGEDNLAVLMQKGNGSTSTLDLIGSSNEIGVDQKGRGNFSDIDVVGNFNGNFDLTADEFGIKVVQEGRGNTSDIDITGDCNFIALHQSGGAISTINQNGNWNSAVVNQESLEE